MVELEVRELLTESQKLKLADGDLKLQEKYNLVTALTSPHSDEEFLKLFENILPAISDAVDLNLPRGERADQLTRYLLSRSLYYDIVRALPVTASVPKESCYGIRSKT